MVAQRPDKMAPVFLGSNNNETQLELKWTQLSGSQTGNSAITTYELYWDSNTGTANILLKSGLQLSLLLQSLQPGHLYIFKVRAKNVYGYGDFSDQVTFQPVSVPSQMESVVTTLTYPTITVTFTPPDNNGIGIQSY